MFDWFKLSILLELVQIEEKHGGWKGEETKDEFPNDLIHFERTVTGPVEHDNIMMTVSVLRGNLMEIFVVRNI
jgi:hypothetical protein